MKRKFFLLILPLLLVSCENIGQSLTVEDLQEDLDVLQAEFEKFHSGYTRYTPKDSLTDLFFTIKNRVEPSSVLDFYEEVTLITSKVRCGHTRASLPEKTRAKFRQSNAFLPVTIRIIDERLYVIQSIGSSLESGTEIVSINDLTVPLILTTIYDHLSADGLIQSGKRRVTEYFFDYFFQLYLAEGASSFEIKLEGIDQSIKVEGVAWSAIDAIRHTSPYEATMELQHHASHSYLRIGSFGASSLKRNGFDFTDFLADSFSELRDREVENLILDLRGNGGGRDEFGALLVSYLLDHSFGYFERIEVTDKYKGYGKVKKTDDFNLMTSHSGLSIQSSQENHFKGNLFLLTDGWTFSTAADVVSVLDNADRAHIVGEETGGGRFGNTSGSSKSLTLPNSRITVNVPMWKYITALDEKEDTARGVIPTTPIAPSLQQYLANEDAQLAYCLELVKGN